jgi:uncharacterized protein YndB with AHSA1/START domain
MGHAERRETLAGKQEAGQGSAWPGAVGRKAKYSVEEIGNLDRISMTWSQDWERKEKAVLTGRMELNMELGGVGKKKEKKKTKQRIHFHFNSIRLKRAFSHAKLHVMEGSK